MERLTISELMGSPDRLQAFSEALRQGAVAALPTDTLYGFAADGNSEAGVAKVYRLKGREENKPLILFLDHQERLGELGITPCHEIAHLLRLHWPGALTGIFSLAGKPLVAFPHPTLGIRVPAHPDLLRLIGSCPNVLLTTSANRSGQEPLQDPDAIEAEFRTELDFLLDGGVLRPSEPSTVISCDRWPPRVFRQGKVRIA